MEHARIIVGVPGPWPSRSDVVRAVAATTGWIFAGQILKENFGDGVFEAELYDHDPGLAEAFRLAGAGRIPEPDLARIDAHHHTLYVIGPAGGPDHVRAIVRAAADLLDAGGIAVKIESTGVAHTAEHWKALARGADDPDLYRSFVILIRSDAFFDTCGMHAFGLPEVRLPRSIGPDVADRVSAAFNMYAITEAPSLHDGETFQPDRASPVFRISLEEDDDNDPESPFFNPFGRWALAPVD